MLRDSVSDCVRNSCSYTALFCRLSLQNKEAITAALQADLRRPKLECVLAEAMTVIAEADEAIKHVRTWAKHESVSGNQ